MSSRWWWRAEEEEGRRCVGREGRGGRSPALEERGGKKHADALTAQTHLVAPAVVPLVVIITPGRLWVGEEGGRGGRGGEGGERHRREAAPQNHKLPAPTRGRPPCRRGSGCARVEPARLHYARRTRWSLIGERGGCSRGGGCNAGAAGPGVCTAVQRRMWRFPGRQEAAEGAPGEGGAGGSAARREECANEKTSLSARLPSSSLRHTHTHGPCPRHAHTHTHTRQASATKHTPPPPPSLHPMAGLLSALSGRPDTGAVEFWRDPERAGWLMKQGETREERRRRERRAARDGGATHTHPNRPPPTFPPPGEFIKTWRRR